MTEWLPHALRYIDRWLGFQMRASEQPGCAVAIMHRNGMVFERAFGTDDLSAGTPLTTHHRFRVASLSKAFTAAGVMLLREQKRLTLDDAVGMHVGGLPGQVATATVGQLLSHAAGLCRDGQDCAHWDDLRPFPDEAALRAELSRPLVLQPGERLKYSNLGYGLLGLVVSSITGEAFGAWITREVLEKVGLPDVAPDLPEAYAEPLAKGHSSKLPVGRIVLDGRSPANALAPAAGFVSTVGDLARFYSQLDPSAETSLLTTASRREMTRPHWKSLHSSADVLYGLGTCSGSVGAYDCFGHTGAFYGYSSCAYVIPDLRLTISLVINSVDGSAGGWVEAIIHILSRFSKSGPPSPDVASWEGRWWNAWGATDLVPTGSTVLLASPNSTTPFAEASEVEVLSHERGRIKQATGFGSYGEAVVRTFGTDGEPLTLSLAGEEHLQEAALVSRLLRQKS